MAKLHANAKTGRMEAMHPDYICGVNAPPSTIAPTDYNLPIIAGKLVNSAVDFSGAFERMVYEIVGHLPESPPEPSLAEGSGMIGEVVRSANVISRCTDRNNLLLEHLKANL